MTANPREGSLLGLDIGTSGARAIAIDLAGNVLVAATEEYPLATPRPGWTEQEPEDWWAACQAVLRRVVSECGQPPLALGLTGQMHGAVFLDESDHVIRPALLWNDQRTHRQCQEITDKVGMQRLVEITGNAAAAVGNGIVRPGVVSSSVGTSGVVFAHSDEPMVDPRGRLHSFCHAVPGAYHVMGVTLAAGAALRWWRDIVSPGSDFEAMASLAAHAPAGSGGLLFLPYLSGERTPVLDPSARGAFVGLNITHTLAHLPP